MKFYLPINLKALSRFGREPLNGKIFNELVQANRIEVVLSPKINSGLYFYSPAGQHTIVISNHLTSERRAWIGWHEFAHYLQNYWSPVTTVAGCRLGEETDLERQANAFATVATTPNLTLTDPMDYLAVIMRDGRRGRNGSK